MAFNPNLPIELTLADAAQMRSQFNGLFDLIQTIPVGPQGPQGPQGEPGTPGVSVTGAVVDGVTTVNPWDPATASASFDGSLVHFAFGLPRGNDGAQGPQGNNGFDGPPGPQGWPGPTGEPGPPGPPFTSFMVDGVTTLPTADPAWVQSTFDGTWVRLTFGIPRGHDGLQGSAGQNGADGAPGQTGPPFTSFTVDGTNTLQPWEAAYVQTSFDGTFVRFTFGIPRGQDGLAGPQGPPGPPGEVTPAQLETAIAGTASNTNPIATLEIPISDPPTQGEVQQVLAKVNELIVALRRAVL